MSDKDDSGTSASFAMRCLHTAYAQGNRDMSDAAPLPWRNRSNDVVDANGESLGTMWRREAYLEENVARAATVARAVNAEPELRAEVAELRERAKIAEEGMAAASQALHWCAKEACTSGMSWAGKNIVGDRASIDYVRTAVHHYEQRDAFAGAWKERLDGAVAERDAKLRIANAVVKAASRFSDCAAEFDGDLSVCHEHLDALWSALDQLSSSEIDAALGGGAVG